MAILRGGRRIGNFDIRIGLPRDKSLVDIDKDPRLKRRPGGAGQIQKFQSAIQEGEGFARANRYLVAFNLPGVSKLNQGIENNALTFNNAGGTTTNNELESSETAANVGMMCNSIVLPNRDVNTVDYRTYGPGRQMPYGYSFAGKVEASFYGDKFLRQRMFFENWQKKVFNINTHDMNYYNDYIGSMDIYVLGQFAAETGDDQARVTYAVRLFEVYPQTIGSIDQGYANDEQTIVPVTLNFRNWKNLTIDQVDGATIGKPFGDVPTIKASKDFGLFGGILGKLPPELQRAGRDALQTVKRSLPIGRITGGRLFPPFG